MSYLKVNSLGLLVLILLLSGFSSHSQIRDIRIQDAEFFWNIDPGLGNATQISVSDGNFNQAIENFLDDSTNIPTQGIHVLSIRLKDENGSWGNTFSKAIMVNPALSTRSIKIQQAEYFWDTDPGQGSGTPLVAFDGNFNQAIEDVFDSSPVSMPTSGNHIFNIRLKDEDGNWGSVYSKVILVHNGVTARDIKIQTGEYFWDTDPGQGSGTSLVAIDGNFNQAVEEMLSSSITLPTQGIHVLSIRLKDENGSWGNTFSKAIMVNPALSTRSIKIQQAEYFWDTDPGQGSGTPLVAFDGNFNQAIEDVFDSSPVSMPTSGNHIFNIRLKDEDGTGVVFTVKLYWYTMELLQGILRYKQESIFGIQIQVKVQELA